MGMDSYVRGWLDAPWYESHSQIKAVVDHEEFEMFSDFWVFPVDPTQFWQFTFFGGDFKQTMLPILRRQLEMIVRNVQCNESDGHVNLEGCFHVDGDLAESMLWEIRDGKLIERLRVSD